MPTLRFDEYLDFIDRGHWRQSLFGIDDLFDADWDLPPADVIRTILPDIQKEFDNYLVYGGYPGVVLTPYIEKKQRRLGSIFNDYVRKDLGTLFSIDHLNEFTRLVKILAAQAGGLLTYAHLASALGLNHRTVGRYLDILESTFILAKIFPYRASAKKRLIKAPKIYFFDNGMRNMALGDFAPIGHRADHGSLVENAVFQYLKGKMQDPDSLNLAFWRTSAGAEVDFIQDDFLIEVKAGELTGNAPRALYSCMSNTGLKKALILNRSRMEHKKDRSATVIFFAYCLLK